MPWVGSRNLRLPGFLSLMLILHCNGWGKFWLVDTTPPSPVTALTTSPENSRISLTWKNPTDSDFSGVKIMRKTGSAPVNSNDGTLVYNANGTSLNDTGLTNGTTYFYAAFAYDTAGNYATAAQQSGVPGFPWYTFLGSAGTEVGQAITTATDGGFVLAGRATAHIASLGGVSPLRTHAGGASDFMVVKLTASGTVQWYTFLGGTGDDQAFGITTTTDGGYIVTGTVGALITPAMDSLTPRIGAVGAADILAVKLNSSGILQWYTYLGSIGGDAGNAVSATTDGGAIVVGTAAATNTNLGGIGTPRNGFNASTDMFAAKLNASGDLQWYTFLGSTVGDNGYAVATLPDGSYVVGGYTGAAIATLQAVPPTYPYVGADDWLTVKLSAAGDVQWFSMMGSPALNDNVKAITILSDGNILVAGYARPVALLNGMAPLNANVTDADFWMVKMNTSGVVQWHTFVGSTGVDIGNAVAATSDGGFVVTGSVGAAVTLPSLTPLMAYTGTPNDILVTKINTNGVPVWFTHLGGAVSGEEGNALTIANDGGIVVTGSAGAGYSTLGPLNNIYAHGGGLDFLTIKLRAGGGVN